MYAEPRIMGVIVGLIVHANHRWVSVGQGYSTTNATTRNGTITAASNRVAGSTRSSGSPPRSTAGHDNRWRAWRLHFADMDGGTIDQVIERMGTLLEPMEDSGDPRRHFLATYRRTTIAVHKALLAGHFVDADWVERWDVVFASLYLDALEQWRVG